MSARVVSTLTVGSRRAPPSTGARDASALPRGAHVGEYIIKRHLADGGMASVYEAVHPLIGKRAAVKVLSSALAWDQAIVQRFVREARAVNEIDHPNIVDIFACGQLEDHRNYLVMELLVGETLAQRMCRGPLPSTLVYEILIQVCDALDATHEHHIAHLDLKPENIYLVATRQGTPRVKLLDFGIAALIDPQGAPMPANVDRVFRGTPAYASPEQACDLPGLDGRSDIYSLGVIAYELLIGHRPFQAKNPLDLLAQHVTRLPARPSALGIALAPGLEALLLRMLAKAPERRPGAAAVGARLRASLGAADTERVRRHELGELGELGALGALSELAVSPLSPATSAWRPARAPGWRSAVLLVTFFAVSLALVFVFGADGSNRTLPGRGSAEVTPAPSAARELAWFRAQASAPPATAPPTGPPWVGR